MGIKDGIRTVKNLEKGLEYHLWKDGLEKENEFYEVLNEENLWKAYKVRRKKTGLAVWLLTSAIWLIIFWVVC